MRFGVWFGFGDLNANTGTGPTHDLSRTRLPTRGRGHGGYWVDGKGGDGN